jgi:penicillin G amidase
MSKLALFFWVLLFIYVYKLTFL